MDFLIYATLTMADAVCIIDDIKSKLFLLSFSTFCVILPSLSLFFFLSFFSPPLPSFPHATVLCSKPTNVILWIIKFHVHAARDTRLTMTRRKIVSMSMNVKRIMAGRMFNLLCRKKVVVEVHSLAFCHSLFRNCTRNICIYID